MKEFTLTAIYEAVCQCHDSSFEEKLQCLSNNNCPKFSDKELITIYFWGKAQQLPTRKAIYRLVKQTMLDTFPDLPSYQAFCRRLNWLAPAFQALTEIWQEHLVAKTGDSHAYVVDSCPIITDRTRFSRILRSQLANKVKPKKIRIGDKTHNGYIGIKLSNQ